MTEFAIKVENRSEKGKGKVRRLRAGGQVPAVLYGPGMAPVSVVVDGKELNRIIDHGAEGHLVMVQTAAEEMAVLLKDVRRDPIKGGLLHVDFQKVAMDKKLHTVVPIVIVGEAARAVDGGGCFAVVAADV